ncbi:signal peptidase II [Deinococcus sp. MIMF12]|uniref:Lipoprotein signal peptidase n=1 Tax=Deinococcus rhizophilus TaxID=3049544 RepID=A0ABT7JE41_9DEIO|nr:signal peptidase II [Deinococcus rhizophilus]MDL2343326.1 signal peptidase II [Deinococcus rhizophilus]
MPTLLRRPRAFPIWVPLLIAASLVVADQALKAWALANLVPDAAPVPFIPGLLGWQLTFNTGAAWSLFSGSAVPLAVVRLLVGLGILGYLVVKPQPRLLSVLLAMVAAGAVGNSIDGLSQGQVTDMFYSPLLSAVTQALNAGHFPIFNIADICVVLGTLMLVVVSFADERRSKAGAA